MSSPVAWKNTFEAEIEQAKKARLAGNEGMARVCARRAAGALIGEYLARQGLDADTASAYDRLRYLSELPGVSSQAVHSATLLLTRITPEHTLPVVADLLDEAHKLRQELLGE